MIIQFCAASLPSPPPPPHNATLCLPLDEWQDLYVDEDTLSPGSCIISHCLALNKCNVTVLYREIHLYRINFLHFSYIVDNVLNLTLQENLHGKLTRTFSMSVTCSCTNFCTVHIVCIGRCTKYYVYKNSQLYRVHVCVYCTLCKENKTVRHCRVDALLHCLNYLQSS